MTGPPNITPPNAIDPDLEILGARRCGRFLHESYRRAIEARIARDNATAAADLWRHIDEQVDGLADPNFPRRTGSAPDTFELVAHPNYIVILEEDGTTVTVLNVVHARQNYP